MPLNLKTAPFAAPFQVWYFCYLTNKADKATLLSSDTKGHFEVNPTKTNKYFITIGKGRNFRALVAALQRASKNFTKWLLQHFLIRAVLLDSWKSLPLLSWARMASSRANDQALGDAEYLQPNISAGYHHAFQQRWDKGNAPLHRRINWVIGLLTRLAQILEALAKSQAPHPGN